MCNGNMLPIISLKVHDKLEIKYWKVSKYTKNLWQRDVETGKWISCYLMANIHLKCGIFN